MTRKKVFSLSSLVVLFFSLLAVLTVSNAAAEQQGLAITDVDISTSADEKPIVDVYFDMRSGDGMGITGLKADQCKLEINGQQPALINAEIKPFTQGNRSVGILFLFPSTRNYDESIWAIRSTLANIVQQNISRPIDMVYVLHYDSSAKTLLKWTKGSEASMIASKITSLEESTENYFDFFGAIPPAISAFRNLDNVSQKFIVAVTDCDGGDVVGNASKASKSVQDYIGSFKKNKIIPIFLGYSPDGKEVMKHVRYLREMAEGAGGVYLEATSQNDFITTATTSLMDRVFNQYIYRAEVDGDEFWLEEGPYPVELNIERDNEVFKDTMSQVNWPAYKKNRTMLWVGLGIGGGVLLIVLIVIIAIRRREDDEPIEEEPVEQICPVCSRKVPDQLMGFRGEFCLQGGAPDCPYYMMPDQGKIQITRGPLADCTFFIKQSITTIGSNIDNNVYLNDKTVSRKHAAIKMDEGKRYELRDFGSSNGTFINSEKVERKFLRDGDILRFGTVETVFKLK